MDRLGAWTNEGARRLVLMGLVLAAEAALVVLVYQVWLSFDCRDTGLYTGCRALRLSIVQGLCFGVGFGLYLLADATARAQLRALAQARPAARRWGGAHLLSVAGMLLPALALQGRGVEADFGMLLPVMALAGLCVLASALLWLASPRDLGRWALGRAGALAALGLLAVFLPLVADEAARLWEWGPLAQATFAAVAWCLSLVTETLVVRPDEAIIGANGFLVAVARQCSGIEGLALTTAFLALYAALFRDTLRQRRFWAVVFPLALLASWGFNVLRISVLVLIGAAGSPELALNGFHSFAGWLSFTLLVLIVLSVAHNLHWLQRGGAVRERGQAPPDAVERILPFVVFMIASVAVNALFVEPSAGYPALVFAMGAALWVSRAAWQRLAWRIDPLAIAAGGAIGVLWVATAPTAGGNGAWTATLAPAALAAWIALRMIGTVFLVPLVEELFFRGYVQRRIDDGRAWRRGLAIAVSAVGFAALHDRWLVAGCAGVVFCLIYARQGRLADAIVAHGVANAIVAAVALTRGDWGLI